MELEGAKTTSVITFEFALDADNSSLFFVANFLREDSALFQVCHVPRPGCCHSFNCGGRTPSIDFLMLLLLTLCSNPASSKINRVIYVPFENSLSTSAPFDSNAVSRAGRRLAFARGPPYDDFQSLLATSGQNVLAWTGAHIRLHYCLKPPTFIRQRLSSLDINFDKSLVVYAQLERDLWGTRWVNQLVC